MPKKNLARLQTDLSALADGLPTQRVTTMPSAVSASAAAPQGEEVIQFSLSLRKSLRKELARLAADSDMTMRAFVLNALKAKGLSVADADLIDLRKRGG
jgi:hypothetical protein